MRSIEGTVKAMRLRTHRFDDSGPTEILELLVVEDYGDWVPALSTPVSIL